MGNAAACRGCGAPIEWGTVDPAGRPIPLDPGTHPDGNMVPSGPDRYRVVPTAELPVDGGARRSHFVTCPKSAEFRKRRRNAVTPRVTPGVTSTSLGPNCAACHHPMDAELAEQEPHRETHPACDPTHRPSHPRMAIAEHWNFQLDMRNPWRTSRRRSSP